jgi:hypothetical protein
MKRKTKKQPPMSPQQALETLERILAIEPGKSFDDYVGEVIFTAAFAIRRGIAGDKHHPC